MAKDIYSFRAKEIEGREIGLDSFRDQVLLVVNVASKCGFTPQYEGLEALYRKYKDKGFTVLAFPCNQFGAQEPGNEAEIGTFCRMSYDTTFPLFAKVDVNGDQAHPLFTYLKAERPGFLGTKGIKWNFTKFLVDRKGHVAERFAPNYKPESLSGAIEALLG